MRGVLMDGEEHDNRKGFVPQFQQQLGTSIGNECPVRNQMGETKERTTEYERCMPMPGTLSYPSLAGVMPTRSLFHGTSSPILQQQHASHTYWHGNARGPPRPLAKQRRLGVDLCGAIPAPWPAETRAPWAWCRS